MSYDIHEIGVHGWVHELLPLLDDQAEEQRLLDQAIETLTTAIGKRPVGYRAPSWQFSNYTMEQIKDAGFLYDSSLMASDDAYEILIDGEPSGVHLLHGVPHVLAPDHNHPTVGLIDVAYVEGNSLIPSIAQLLEVRREHV